ncbi:Hypothetical predicted protein [Mytilus galloprovincialis]|uniref:C1q domain-containing protein n=1 Tax=Mytilus galloprovincialis TaxID=29158 RepID=A0A8B6CY49_MYTGA|nr:Hypothetical predicted protein [Mytilus galloprovincialis]
MEVFTEAEKKRKSVTELMMSSLDREREEFNSSYDQIVENFKVTSSKTLQELIVNQQKGYEEMVKKRDPVAFSAYRTSSQSLSSNVEVIFDKVWTNVGNGYNPNTGIFTVPRTGLYHLTAVILSKSGTEFYPRLYHNKVHLSGSYITGDGYKTGTFDVVFSLQKGEQVYIAGSYVESIIDSKIFPDEDFYPTFSNHIFGMKDFKGMMEKRETVAFSAYRSSSQALSSGEKVIFDGLWTNVGNGYEPSTGVFTAPYPGLYHLTAVVVSTHGNSLGLYLCHNGLRMTRSYLSGDGYKTGTFDVVFNLQKGDTVHIDGDGGHPIFSTSSKYVTFSGYRIT